MTNPEHVIEELLIFVHCNCKITSQDTWGTSPCSCEKKNVLLFVEIAEARFAIM